MHPIKKKTTAGGPAGKWRRCCSCCSLQAATPPRRSARRASSLPSATSEHATTAQPPCQSGRGSAWRGSIRRTRSSFRTDPGSPTSITATPRSWRSRTRQQARHASCSSMMRTQLARLAARGHARRRTPALHRPAQRRRRCSPSLRTV